MARGVGVAVEVRERELAVVAPRYQTAFESLLTLALMIVFVRRDEKMAYSSSARTWTWFRSSTVPGTSEENVTSPVDVDARSYLEPLGYQMASSVVVDRWTSWVSTLASQSSL